MAAIRRILVANRGEIARRVFRSCRKLGLETVAVYSDADVAAAHVSEADQARLLGPAPARESYLCAEKVLDAARSSGADAIHPGYGFLAEDADFADAVTAAGLAWIGPDAQTIRAMGDKQRARDLARAAGIPVVPGSRRIAPGEDDVGAIAETVGYPLLVKAAAGGGGIGMRRVGHPGELDAAVTTARSLAESSFGDGSLYFERLVPRARHLEVQVFGFGNGDAVHLHERDCSLQRRFQKVIEESPAPRLPEIQRSRISEAAIELCRATRYRCAGTVEFIVDADTFDFFFLEMNTRIQVEHPVSELVTGRDLVAMQIELARNTLEPIGQEAIRSRGHAVECRLYAEDPAKMFLPSPGPLTVFRPPAATASLRVESGYREGDTVTPFYDPLLAKVIAWGENRDEARQVCVEALRGFAIDGVRHNRDFLIACLLDPVFAAGDVTTDFIGDRRDMLLEAAGG